MWEVIVRKESRGWECPDSEVEAGYKKIAQKEGTNRAGQFFGIGMFRMGIFNDD